MIMPEATDADKADETNDTNDADKAAETVGANKANDADKAIATNTADEADAVQNWRQQRIWGHWNKINNQPVPQSSLHKIVGAGCAPSERGSMFSTINQRFETDLRAPSEHENKCAASSIMSWACGILLLDATIS